MTTYPLTIVLSVGQPLVLNKVEPQDSELAFADEVARAVESETQQVGGDGEREPHWKVFDTWLPTPTRPKDRGAALGAFENSLRFAIRAEMDGLRYDISRIRVVGRGPYGSGYRLKLKMIGPRPDFYEVNGSGVFVQYAPLW
ncbi:hypothetical protein GO986_16240 [Deinococcus sp. HMF7620]|uniref:Uncharacterized protein n=1 Tax=Deinococcus arboris TaxID=2682977 RepID=A0A7C9LQ54_9DEIO|nr:hypothetical protein [Deinococcus arboris]MVN88296.1 hypothetical protein [Deinococcus arboris]